MKRLGIFCLLLVFAGCSCGDPCDPKTDTAHCEGDSVVYCPEPGVDQIFGANRWVHRDCTDGKVCVESLGSALCSLSKDPEPLCPSDGGVTRVCADATHEFSCSLRYAEYKFDCLRCDAPTEDGGSATCVGGPSAKCQNSTECAPTLSCSSLGYCQGKADGG